MGVVNLREPFGRRFKIGREEGYFAQYGLNARVRDPHYDIIPGSRGHVYAWGAFVLAASTNTSVKALPGVELWQDGSDGCTILFPVDLLDRVADLLKLRRRRQVTEEERRRLSELGHRHGFQPQQRGFHSDLEAQRCVSEAQPDPKHVPDAEAIAGCRETTQGIERQSPIPHWEAAPTP